VVRKIVVKVTFMPKARITYMLLYWKDGRPDKNFIRNITIESIRDKCRKALKANLAGREEAVTVYPGNSRGMREERIFEFGRIDHAEDARIDEELTREILEGL
jgi:hypothetical protein